MVGRKQNRVQMLQEGVDLVAVVHTQILSSLLQASLPSDLRRHIAKREAYRDIRGFKFPFSFQSFPTHHLLDTACLFSAHLHQWGGWVRIELGQKTHLLKKGEVVGMLTTKHIVLPHMWANEAEAQLLDCKDWCTLFVIANPHCYNFMF